MKLSLPNLHSNLFSSVLLKFIPIVILLAANKCDCGNRPTGVQKHREKDQSDNTEKNAGIGLSVDKTHLTPPEHTFTLTLQHQGKASLPLDSYTLEISLQEEGTKLKYTDAGKQPKELTSIQESLTHFSTLQELDTSASTFDIPFELVPNPQVNKVTITVKLYPKDNPTSSQQESIIWEKADPTKLQEELRKAYDADDADAFQRLLDQGADPNIFSLPNIIDAGYTQTKVNILEPLLKAPGININKKDGSGNTALHALFYTTAAYNDEQRLKILQLLLTSPNIDINAQNDVKETPLHTAMIGRSSKEMIELLLANPKIRIGLKDRWGSTPLDKARDPNIKKLLQDHK